MRPKKCAIDGSSQYMSRCEIQPGTYTRSGGPSPITWYAMWYSPLRAYFVSGRSIYRRS